jgi:cyclase
MLKTRVMPTLLHKDLGLVKGVRFDSWRRVGSAMQAVKVYNMREVDELVFLDIAATREGRAPDYELVDDLADECFMPLTVGGGVRTLEHFERLLKVGADKVAVNTALVERPQIVAEAAATFGAQCVIASIDAFRSPDGALEVLTRSGTARTGRDPVDLAVEAQDRGAGEVLLTSVDRDGTMEGYDLELIGAVAAAVTIPVIASGGAGEYRHMAEALLDGGASAVAAASMFHFTEQTPLEAKHHLRDCGVAVRI